LLAASALFAWLAALGLFVATFVSGVEPLVLAVEGWPLFAMTFLVVVIANRALASTGLRGKEFFAFYAKQPRIVAVVQVLLLVLSIALGLSIPPGRANGDVCAVTVNGERVEMSPADCRTLRIRGIRVFAVGWMTIGWLAVAQFVAGRKKEHELPGR